MYFGDFLIQNKTITPDDLVRALCYQLESMPSFFRIIIESKYVSSEDVLMILKKNIKQDIDIVDALLKEKKITDNQIHELSLKHLSLKVPLGETLVKIKIINQEELNRLLGLYFSEKNNSIALKQNDEVSDAALESLKELGIDISEFETKKSDSIQLVSSPALNSEIPKRLEVGYFLNVFNEKQKNKFLKLIDILEATQEKSDELSNYFNSLFRDVHILKGAAGFSDISSCEPFLIELDLILDSVLTSGEKDVELWCKSHLQKFKLFIIEFWIIRSEIETFQSDLGLNENHSSIVKCKGLISLMR